MHQVRSESLQVPHAPGLFGGKAAETAGTKRAVENQDSRLMGGNLRGEQTTAVNWGEAGLVEGRELLRFRHWSDLYRRSGGKPAAAEPQRH